MERNENGYSNFSLGNRSRTAVENENGSCPGTGDLWQGENGMSRGNLGSNQSDCSERQLGMVYSPFQCWRMMYSVDDALNHGTLFEELYKPLEER